MKKGILLSLIIFSILYSQIQWGQDIRITGDTVSPFSPRAAVWGDTIHLVWRNVADTDDIFYMRSTDGGNTWEEPKNLTINDPDDAILPWITVWGNKIHVVYQEGPGGDSTMYVRSLDGGNSWENPERLAKPGYLPSIAGTRDTLYVIFTSSNGLNIRRSLDGGTTWLPQQVIDTTTGGREINVSSYLYIIGIGVQSTIEIFYLRSPDKGETWEGPFIISPDDGHASQLPTMSVSDSSVYIAWDDWASFFTDYIFERHSHDNGNSFSPYQNLAPLGRAQGSEIYTNGEFVILVWKDNRFNGGTDFDLFWRMSTDGGNTWTDESLLSDTSAIVVSSFCVTGWGNDVYVFWSDERNNELALYFKKGIYVNVEESIKSKNKEINILSSNILFLPDKIKFYVKKGKEYSLSLIDLQGRRIKMVKEGRGRGKEEIVLDGVIPGSYFLVLETKDKTLKKKITILKGGKQK